jgi:hypothetical protein
MIEVGADDLKLAVESQHGCTATLAQSVPVKETFGGKTVWEGIVHVFKINGHPKAVHGEFVNYAAIGIWNRLRQWCRQA